MIVADPLAENCDRQRRIGRLRAEADLRNEKINYKVREHSVQKVPLMFVVGKREDTMGIRTVSVNELDFVDCRVPASQLLGGREGAEPPVLPLPL